MHTSNMGEVFSTVGIAFTGHAITMKGTIITSVDLPLYSMVYYQAMWNHEWN